MQNRQTPVKTMVVNEKIYLEAYIKILLTEKKYRTNIFYVSDIHRFPKVQVLKDQFLLGGVAEKLGTTSYRLPLILLKARSHCDGMDE